MENTSAPHTHESIDSGWLVLPAGDRNVSEIVYFTRLELCHPMYTLQLVFAPQLSQNADPCYLN